jgi:hypothetical protein
MEYAEQQETNLSVEVFSYLNSNCITQYIVVQTEMLRNKNPAHIENHETPLFWGCTRR